MSRRLLALLATSAALAFASCVTAPGDPKDAGEAAFVRRAVPLLWGRQPSGSAEVQLLADLAERDGREALVRAMATADEFRARWTSVLWDRLSIARVGKQTTRLCFEETTAAAADTTLAQWVRDERPNGYFASRFTFADLAHSALRLDDLSPLWRANILGFSARDRDANTLAEGVAHRRILGEIFLRNYIGRALECLPCHNSEWGLTDHDDPTLDRSWPVAGRWEEPLFGESGGADPEAFWPYFRRYGVVGGFVFSSEPDAWPPTADRGCIATHLSGCSGCACEGEVCAADSRCCDDRWDESCAARCFAASTTTCADPVLVYPWGLDARCGRLVNPAQLQDDLVSSGAHFIEDAGATSSIWDLEPHFDAGIRALRERGLPAGPDAHRDGDRAFAALWAMRVVDQVWAEAMGAPLTIQHGLPRNRAQRDRLRTLSRTFVDGGFSLTDLLVAITADPHWNARAPADGGLAEGDPAYAWDAIFDPWTIEDEREERRGNGYGERIHALDPRVVQWSAHQAMGWRPPTQFMGGDGADEQDAQRLQEAIGVWQKEGNRGGGGPNTQQALAWEHAYGACTDATPRPWGCLSMGDPGCPGCACEDTVCSQMPECCDVRWGEECAAACASDGCVAAEPAPPDFVDRLLDGSWAGQTLEDGVLALKDRLLADGAWDDGERAAVGALLGTAWDTPVTDPAAAEALRAVCALWLVSPQPWLGGHAIGAAPRAPPVPGPLQDLASTRTRLEAALGLDLP